MSRSSDWLSLRRVYHVGSWKVSRFLAQATLSRLSELTCRPKMQPLAWASARGRTRVSILILSPRRGELAWARIAELTTVNPHAVAETAQIHSQTHMQGRKTTQSNIQNIANHLFSRFNTIQALTTWNRTQACRDNFKLKHIAPLTSVLDTESKSPEPRDSTAPGTWVELKT